VRSRERKGVSRGLREVLRRNGRHTQNRVLRVPKRVTSAGKRRGTPRGGTSSLNALHTGTDDAKRLSIDVLTVVLESGRRSIMNWRGLGQLGSRSSIIACAALLLTAGC